MSVHHSVDLGQPAPHLTVSFLVQTLVMITTPIIVFSFVHTGPGSYVLGIPLDVINARQVIINANGFCGNQRTLMREVRSGMPQRWTSVCCIYMIHVTLPFPMHTDNTVCHAHQINGVDEEATVVGNTATVMFEGTGPISTNVISDFLIEIQRVQPNGSIMELDVFLCSTAAPSPPYTATCQVDAGEAFCVSAQQTMCKAKASVAHLLYTPLHNPLQ